MFAVINGCQREFSNGLTILSAINQIGIQVPTACFDPRLKPYGGCRLCIVKLEGKTRPVPSCSTHLEKGMVIETHSSDIEHERRILLELLRENLAESPLQKEFYKSVSHYGLKGKSGHKAFSQPDSSHPYIQADMSQCISCYRCVRICNELQGQFVWRVWNRGNHTTILPDSNTTLADSSCVGCGACVDTCPTTALCDKSVIEHGEPEHFVRTTCVYCGVGCEMNVGVRKNTVVQIRPVIAAPVNRGHLCIKGRYAYEYVNHPDRILEPLLRTNNGWKKLNFEQAIQYSADRLKKIIAEHGPDSIGVLGSARATNEENYLAQKFARVAIGTNNIDCCARVCHAPSAAALRAVLGTGASTNSFCDIEQAETFLIVGSNATENHPIVGARIKQQVLKGSRLIVIDPRKIELCRYSNIHLQIKAGTNIPVLHAIANVICNEELYDRKFVDERTEGFESFARFIQSWTPETVAPICGIDPKLIREAARLYAGQKPAMSFHGLGLTEHSQGTESVKSLINLALLTGNLGKRGTGINPLRGQNNVQGAAHMGCEPNYLAGFVPLQDGKALFESVWKTAIPASKGLNWMQMVDAATNGKLKALWAIGYDVLLTNPAANVTASALAKLDFIMVQDLFLNETAKAVGTIFFPACSHLEKDGTFMNSERRVQRVRKVLEPIGSSQSDWEIICALATAMGHEKHFSFQSPADIWNEIRMLWKAGAGITYARIEKHGLQWPVINEEHPGTEILHEHTFQSATKAKLQMVEYQASTEKVDSDYPFILITGRKLAAFNAGTMTSRTPNRVIHPTDTLSIAASDAKTLGLTNHDVVKIISRYGDALVPICIDDSVREGELFTTFSSPNVFINRVTSQNRDSITATPEYKVTAVRIEKAGVW